MKEFRKTVKVHPLVLYREDLFELEQILKDDINWKEDYFEITATDNHQHFMAKSIEELLKIELPNWVNNLSVSINGWDEKGEIGIVKGISLTMYHNYIDYHVYSHNEIWFLGKIEQLRNFLKHKKPWYSIISKILPFISFFAIIPLSIAIAYFKIGIYLPAILFLLSFLLFMIIVVLNFKQIVFPYVRIYFQSRPKKRISLEKIVLMASIINLVGAVISIIKVTIGK